MLLLPSLLLKAKSECLLVSHACSMEHSIKDTSILVYFSFECFFLFLFPNQDMSKQRSYPKEAAYFWEEVGGGRRGEEGRRVHASQKRHMCEACKGV